MLKDHTRDYAVSAFRRYAKLGCVSVAEYEEKIRNDVYIRYENIEPKRVLIKAEEAVKAAAPLLSDIDAVERSFAMLRANGKEYIVDAVMEVYFVSPDKPLRKNQIQRRVLAFAMKVPADERTVYRWLKNARDLFAVCRGLTLSDS